MGLDDEDENLDDDDDDSDDSGADVDPSIYERYAHVFYLISTVTGSIGHHQMKELDILLVTAHFYSCLLFPIP